MLGLHSYNKSGHIIKFKMPYKNKEDERKYQKEYYQNNKKKLNLKNKEYQREYHKEYQKTEKWKLYLKNWRERNKDKISATNKRAWKNNGKKISNQLRINQYKIKKRKEDKNFNISTRLRGILRKTLRKYTRTGKIQSSSKYGINHKTIIEHLKPFPQDLSKYHIDHIKPLCSFEFVCLDGSIDLNEIQKAFAPENHQWLTIKENLSKGGKLNEMSKMQEEV